MVDLRYKDNPLWVLSATAAEKAEVERLDKKIEALTQKRKALSVRRYAITNRCTVRTIGRREAS